MNITYIEPGLPSIKSCIKSWMSDIDSIQKKAAYDICENLYQVSYQLDYARELLKSNDAYIKWCKKELDWSPRHALRVREAGRVAGILMNSPGVTREKNNLPSSERQLRVLVELNVSEDKLQSVWSDISEEVPLNGKGNIKSAAAIKNTLAEHGHVDAPAKKITSKPKPKAIAVSDSDAIDAEFSVVNAHTPADVFDGMTVTQVHDWLSSAATYCKDRWAEAAPDVPSLEPAPVSKATGKPRPKKTPGKKPAAKKTPLTESEKVEQANAKRYAELSAASAEMGEENDSAVIAVATLAGVSYKKAHSALKSAGRENGWYAGVEKVKAAFKKLGFTAQPPAMGTDYDVEELLEFLYDDVTYVAEISGVLNSWFVIVNNKVVTPYVELDQESGWVLEVTK